MLSRALEKTTKDFIIAINQASKGTGGADRRNKIADNLHGRTQERAGKQSQSGNGGSLCRWLEIRRGIRSCPLLRMHVPRLKIQCQRAHMIPLSRKSRTQAEATGGDFTEFEIGVLLEKCAGHYWAMKLLSRLTRDNTNAAAILKERFKMPDPNYYLTLFDDEEGYLLGFIQIYKDDQAAPMDIARSDVNGETLISGDHFQRLHERLEINPDYLTDDDFSAPVLRSFERRTLRSSGIVLDVNDAESRKKVKAAARQGGAVKNCLMRTVWKTTIDEEIKIMWAEAQDNAQIKYGSAGRTAFNAVGSRY